MALAGQQPCGDPLPTDEVLFAVEVQHWSGHDFYDYAQCAEWPGANPRLVTHVPLGESVAAADQWTIGSEPFAQHYSLVGDQGTLQVSLGTDLAASARYFFFKCSQLVIRIDVYIKGHSGTRYFAHRRGAGRTLASHDGSTPRSVYLNEARWNSFNFTAENLHEAWELQDGEWAGFTGSEITYRGTTYSYARSFTERVGIRVSSDTCIIGCPAPSQQIALEASGRSTISAGIGWPQCTGEIDMLFCGPCVETSSGIRRTLQRTFAVTASIEPGSPLAACDCCEYRQFVRRYRITREFLSPWVQGTWPFTWILPNDYPTSCDPSTLQYVEDHQVGAGRYGYRVDHLRSNGYYALPRLLSDICAQVPPPARDVRGCHFAAIDTPAVLGEALNLGFSRPTSFELEFEGRLISKAGCTPGATHDVVVAQRNWTVACSTTPAPASSGTPPAGGPGRTFETTPLVVAAAQVPGSPPGWSCTSQVTFAERDGKCLALATLHLDQGFRPSMQDIDVTVDGIALLPGLGDSAFEFSRSEGGKTTVYYPFFSIRRFPDFANVRLRIGSEVVTWPVRRSAFRVLEPL